jgi:hypothetical protein
MARQPKKPLDELLESRGLARNYAEDFDCQREKIEELAKTVFQAHLRSKPLPPAAFKALADAAHDLWFALEGTRSADAIEIIRMPAAALCGSMERLAKALGKIK